jgi:glycosyltransferase involved in cell wall biosynthesis
MSKLLVLCEYPTLLGGERSLLSVLDGVQAAGYDATVACPAHGPLAEELDRREIPRVAADWHDPARRRRPLADLREEIARLCRRLAPRLVHANGLSIGRVAGPVVDELRLASVSHLRDIVKLRRAEVADLNRFHRIVAVSRATRDFHVAQGLDADRVAVVYNGVDLERFRPAAATGWLHRELGIPSEAPLIGTVGQISLRKGLDTLLAAALQVAQDTPEPHWVVVGSCHSHKEETLALERTLARAAAAGPLAGRLHCLGERVDVARILPELALLVHPARQEPLGRILLEAAAAGAAIVATDVGGTPEIFPAQARAAVLIRPDAPAELAGEIQRLLADATERRRLGQAARRNAERFTISAATSGLTAQYEQACDDAYPGGHP